MDKAGPPDWLETMTVEGQKRIDEAATARQRMIEAMPAHKPAKVIRAPAAGPGFDCQDCIGMREHGCYCAAMGAVQPGVAAYSAALNEATTRELRAAQEADELRAALRELVALAEMKARLENLHAMGHGTDWDSYHKRHPAAWAAARLLALGPNVRAKAPT